MTYTPILDRRIRIALIGCGRISKNHLDAIVQHDTEFELVGLCDHKQNAVMSLADNYGVPPFQDLEKMVKETDPDVVTICTPSGLHPKQTIQIAKLKKHVITEKPMATKWEDGLAMVEACHDASVRLFVVKQNRQNETLQLLKKTIDAGRFGKIYMANVNVFWTRPQSYYDQADWRGTWALDGGALMNQASHYVDLLHWMIGPVKRLHAFTATLARNIEVEDTAVINFEWEQGALGSMNVTMLTYPENYKGSITILGEHGTVRVGGTAVNEIEHWVFRDEQPEDQKIQNTSYQTTSVYGFGHPLYYHNVAQVLRGKAEPKTDGEEGLKSLELLIAAYRSAQTEQVIHLPLPKPDRILG